MVRRRIFLGVSTRALLAVVFLTVAAPPALAGDTWTTPFPGVDYLHRTTTSPSRHIFVAVVDLCAPGVSLRATTMSDFGEPPSTYVMSTTSQFVSLVGAQVAINASFSGGSAQPWPYGLSVGNGETWPGTGDNSDWSGFIAFGTDRVLLQPPAENVGPPQPWMIESVGSGNQLVRDGAVLTSFTHSHCPEQHPRTGVGLSRDRRTLYLAVVDGRRTSRVGMTCQQFGALMHELGAWDALNLDGGGSSTMVIQGQGVVNSPSDGSERYLPNHLAVYATGQGLPGSCVDARNALMLTGDQFDWGRTSDLDGDGMSDVCARDANGMGCSLSTGTSLAEEPIAGPPVSDALGWSDPSNWATLRLGDINGDGLADVCGRDDAGILCWLSTGAGFEEAIDGPALSDVSGWSELSAYGTLRLADFNGDGLDDLCGRDAAGFGCWPSTGAGFGERVAGPGWSDAIGWAGLSHAGTIRMGDIDGDGRADVCARSVEGVECYLSDGVGFPTAVPGPDWSDANGWAWPKYWSTIRMVDLDADGRADLCARTATDFRCYLSEGNAFGREIIGPPLSDADGWNALHRYGTIRLGDIDGDGRQDVCARGGDGVLCWRFDGTAFSEATVLGPVITDADGWGAERFWRTLRLADLDGDGYADICARGAAGLHCWLSDGTSDWLPIDGPAWGDAQGWGDPMYYGTIQLAGQVCTPRVEVCNGKDDDCDGLVDEGCYEDGGVAADGGGTSDGSATSDASGDEDSPSGGCSCRAGSASGNGCGLIVCLVGLWLAFRRRRPRR